MENLGIASTTVKLLSKLPYASEFVTRTNFESSAFNWQSLQNSPFFPPLLAEQIIDPSGTFAAIIPSRRIHWVHSQVKGLPFRKDSIRTTEENNTAVVPKLTIAWTRINKKQAEDSVMEEVIAELPEYTLPNIESQDENDGYEGPIWENSIERETPVPDDETTIDEFRKWIGDKDDEDDKNESETNAKVDDKKIEIPFIGYLHQTRVKSGLWWGMESTKFLKENMPFWIHIAGMESPSANKYPTSFVVSLGLTDPDNRFDIYLSENQKPRLYDWYKIEDDKKTTTVAAIGGGVIGEASEKKKTPYCIKEFEIERSRTWAMHKDHRIGVMTVAGRLVIIVDGYTMVYTRIQRKYDEDGGTIAECKIAEGSIKIYGTNCKMKINVSPMTFAYFSAIAIQAPVLTDLEKESTPSFHGVSWAGASENKTIDIAGKSSKNLTVCELPTPPSEKEQRYGCDCSVFYDANGKCNPDGFGLHSNGEIEFKRAQSEIFEALPNTEFYWMKLKPSDIIVQEKDESNDKKEVKIPNAGAPYYFRLKGIHEFEEEERKNEYSGDITNYVISVDETVTAPDYFHIKKSANIVCYDENAVISNLLTKGQTGVEITWGDKTTFTGIATGVNTGKKAGMETVSITVEDYMFILKNTPIINSPFFDGMVAFYAIKEMAKKANLESVINEWKGEKDEDEYFLPSGYSFSKPLMRFESENSIFDCMMDVIKRFEAFIFFDELGRLVVSKFPGGLFSELEDGDSDTYPRFHSDPDDTGMDDGFEHFVILEEKQVEVDYSSTFNVISAMTLGRDTRNAIMYTKTANSDENNLLFKRVHMLNKAALGELEVCRNYVEDLSDRLFQPILKTRWKTLGTVAFRPLEFVIVDNQIFRLTSLKRSYKAETNYMDTSYEGEWLGGKV